MPTASKNAKNKARLKRQLRTMKQVAQQAAISSNRSFGTVLLLLANSGGEVTIRPDIVAQIVPLIEKLRYESKADDDGSITIRLVGALPQSVMPQSFEGAIDQTNALLAEGDEPVAAAAAVTDAPVDPTIAAGDPA